MSEHEPSQNWDKPIQPEASYSEDFVKWHGPNEAAVIVAIDMGNLDESIRIIKDHTESDQDMFAQELLDYMMDLEERVDASSSPRKDSHYGTFSQRSYNELLRMMGETRASLGWACRRDRFESCEKIVAELDGLSFQTFEKVQKLFNLDRRRGEHAFYEFIANNADHFRIEDCYVIAKYLYNEARTWPFRSFVQKFDAQSRIEFLRSLATEEDRHMAVTVVHMLDEESRNNAAVVLAQHKESLDFLVDHLFAFHVSDETMQIIIVNVVRESPHLVTRLMRFLYDKSECFELIAQELINSGQSAYVVEHILVRPGHNFSEAIGVALIERGFGKDVNEYRWRFYGPIFDKATKLNMPPAEYYKRYVKTLPGSSIPAPPPTDNLPLSSTSSASPIHNLPLLSQTQDAPDLLDVEVPELLWHPDKNELQQAEKEAQQLITNNFGASSGEE